MTLRPSLQGAQPSGRQIGTEEEGIVSQRKGLSNMTINMDPQPPGRGGWSRCCHGAISARGGRSAFRATDRTVPAPGIGARRFPCVGTHKRQGACAPSGFPELAACCQAIHQAFAFFLEGFALSALLRATACRMRPCKHKTWRPA